VKAAEVHYLWPEGHPVEKCSTSGSVALRKPSLQDGGRTGDVRDRLVVGDDPQPQDDLSHARSVPSTSDGRLAPLEGGRYEVPRPVIGTKSTSSTSHCALSPTGSSAHLRLASIYIALTTDQTKAAFPDQTARLPPRSRIGLLHRTDCVAISTNPVGVGAHKEVGLRAHPDSLEHVPRCTRVKGCLIGGGPPRNLAASSWNSDHSGAAVPGSRRVSRGTG